MGRKSSGKANNNTILDTREYIIEFMDGCEETMTPNLIAEYLFSQVDDDGNCQVLLDEIIDHRVDTKIAVHEKDAYIKVDVDKKNVRRPPKAGNFIRKMERWMYKLDITKRYEGKLYTPSS